MQDICSETRKALLESANLEIFTPKLSQARTHLRKCRQCADFLQQYNAIRGFLKETLVGEKAPVSVREDIFQAIAQRQSAGQGESLLSKQDRQRRSRKILIYGPVAALLFLVLLVFTYILLVNRFDSYSTRNSLSAELIDDHIRYRLSAQAVEITITEPQALTQWFNNQLDFGARIPRLNGFKLVGGRLCYLFDHRVALAFYQAKDLWVSLYVLNGEGIDLSGMENIPYNGKVLCRGYGKGYQVVAWKDKDLLYAMVSDRDVLELAKHVGF